MSENGSERSEERMRDHLRTISSQYEHLCHDMDALGEYGRGGEFFRAGETHLYCAERR